MPHNPRMAYRLLRSWLLVAALLFSQLGALSHGASHLHDADEVPHTACAWCMGYAGLDHGLTSAPLDLGRADSRPTPPAEGALPLGRAALPPYLSRAPPAVPL